MSDTLQFDVEPDKPKQETRDLGYGDPQDMRLESLPRLETEEALWLA